ncbi:cytochrome P450 [Hysterangium stoloniferum]|nr:cytochrome P450 [Hysterangium stoloniferum]
MHYRVQLLFCIFQGLVLPPAVSYVLLSRIPLHLPHPALLVFSILSVPLLNILGTRYTAYRASKLQALPIPVVRGRWPGNVDVLMRLLIGVKEGYINETLKEMCEECASPTINLRVMWVNQLIISSHSPGIFATDGDLWKTHRSTLRPFLFKSQMRASDANMWAAASKGVTRVLARAYRNGATIDIQDLAQRYTLDIALDALLGIDSAGMVDDLGRSIVAATQSTNTQEGTATALQPEDITTSPSHIKAFAHAMDKAADTVIMRARRGVMWRVVEFRSDRTAPLARTMHRWVDAVIERELKRPVDMNAETFVGHLVRSTDDKTMIRDQLINMVFGARDTTAALITFVVYFLAIEREIYKTLSAEITRLCPPGASLPSPEQLKEFVYLRAVLNETLRIFPSVPINTRYSTTESVLPPAVYNVKVNGVDSADSRWSAPPSKYYVMPLYMPPNTSVSVLKLLMQRRADLWGEDAEEFRPGRWLASGQEEQRIEREQEKAQRREQEQDGMGRRPPEWFVPFSAGPRLCPGQKFAYVEASYFIISCLQAGFKFALDKESQPVETRPPKEWKDGNVHAQDEREDKPRKGTGVFVRGMGRKSKEECWPGAAFTLFSKEPGHSEERTRTGKYLDGAYSICRIQAPSTNWGQCVAVLWPGLRAREHEDMKASAPSRFLVLPLMAAIVSLKPAASQVDSTAATPAAAPYILPHSSTTDKELARLNAMHHAFQEYLDGRLSLAPLEESNPQAILESGSGLWAIEAALQFPTARVTAVDLQPISRELPSNLEMGILNFPSLSLEGVLMDIFQLSHATDVLVRIIRLLKPGGWLVIDDQDLHFTGAGPATSLVFEKYIEIMQSRGVSFPLPTYEKTCLAMGVFGEVHTKEIPLCISEQSNDVKINRLGAAYRVAFLAAVDTVTGKGTPGFTKELTQACREEMNDLQRDTVFSFNFTWAQKKKV